MTFLSLTRNFSASSLSLEKDKKDFEKTIEAGKPSIFLFKYSLIVLISSLDIIEPRYNLLSGDNGNDLI